MSTGHGGRSQNWKFLVGIAFGLAPVLVFGGVDASALEVGTPFDDQGGPAIEDGQPLSVEPADAQYLTRIFTERNHEIGYCVGISGTTLSFWLADTVQATEGSLEMKTSNCPPEMRAATAHTHPSGRVGLSERDKTALYSSEASIMCIHAGDLSAEPGAELDNLACYERVEGDDPRQIDVRITGSGAGAG